MKYTREALMIPRVCIKATWPGMPLDFKVGDILEDVGGLYRKPIKTVEELTAVIPAAWIDLYPHLFTKLEWWEKRHMHQMPSHLIVRAEKVNNRKWKGLVVECGIDVFWNSRRFDVDLEGYVLSYGGIYINCFEPYAK